MKRKTISLSFIATLSAGLIITSLFLPVVNLIARTFDDARIDIISGDYSFITYIKDSVFLNTEAFDSYFGSQGPVWLPVLGILFNYFIAVAAAVLIIVSAVSLFTIKKSDNPIIKNAIAKKIALFIGFFTIFTAIFQFTSFIITTLLANGYVEFYPRIGVYVNFALGIFLTVSAYCFGKKEKTETFNEGFSAVGYICTAVFGVLSFAMIFLPQLSVHFGLYPRNSSFYEMITFPNLFAEFYHNGGEYPIGLSFYAVFLTALPLIFTVIYSVIGFILSLCKKQSRFLSSRIKRWSFTYLLMYSILYFLILADIAVLTGGFTIFEFSLVLPVFYVAFALPFLPYFFSSFVPIAENL